MTSNRRLREDALTIFRAGLDAVEPGRLVAQALDSDILTAEQFQVVGVGKAAFAMAEPAIALLGPTRLMEEPLVISDRESSRPTGCRVLAAGHPLPDARSVLAGAEVTARVKTLDQNQGVLVLLSGGSSAMLAAPVPGVSLADKAEVTRRLLARGTEIHELNTVRKHLSTLKGGGVARLVSPAPLVTLILSDVIDDDASAIGSGPTVPDPTTYLQALEVLNASGIWGTTPESIRRHLLLGVDGARAETPKPGDPIFDGTIVRLLGGIATCLAGARLSADTLGFGAQIVDDRVGGEARVQAESLAQIAGQAASQPGPTAWLWGGETTVTVRGQGLGGRNQELALAFALAMEREAIDRDWVLLSGGTDGRDGPTDAAGGMVDRETTSRIRGAGIDPREALDRNDSHRALGASGDLVTTGPTGTNVADVQVLLLS